MLKLKLSVSLLGLLMMGLGLSLAQDTEKQSKPGAYEGYSQEAYKEWKRISTYVTMSDGTRLATDVLIPQIGPPKESFPVVFQFTPYGRSYMLPKMGPVKHLVSKSMGLGWGPEYDQGIIPYVERLLKHGYVVVTADLRGTGASFGSNTPLMPQFGQDGKELIDWIGEQSWCDGKVGMMGPSYLAWVQYFVAAQRPKNLVCIAPEVMFFDVFTGGFRPGGIAAKRWVQGFSDHLFNINSNLYKLKDNLVPALSVIDEDGDGKLNDERPKMDSASLAQGLPPVYRDGNTRQENLYYQATLDHMNNVRISQLLDLEYAYFDVNGPPPLDKQTYMESSPGYMAQELAQAGIPIYSMGGWFDGFAKGSVKMFATLDHLDLNYNRLLMVPRFHLPGVTKEYRKYTGFPDKYMPMHGAELHRFFDHYLKGVDNGFDQEPPVCLYVMNEGWRFEESWPLEREIPTDFFLGENQRLSLQESPEGQDAYQVDFSHNNHFGKDSINRWTMTDGAPDDVMNRTKADRKTLVYETAALTQDVEITGHPIVHLWVSSNQSDGDFFVYLSEVNEKGEAIYITEGQLRAGYHASFPDDDQIGGRVDVKPDLPWHGYKKDDYQAEPLANGNLLELVFDLQPTSWKVQKGRKIRISIAGADASTFEKNPFLCPDGKCPETEIKVHRGPETPSRIVLPVVPAKQVIAEEEDKEIPAAGLGGEENN
ncbi:MAG: CocE/NonD family hydrolase [Bacteroidota bacterium]